MAAIEGVALDCLEGVRVVDFTQFEAGPSCTEALAWLGAEVVKIENPKTGDPGRRLRPGHPDDDPWYFHQFNANKKSLTLNLKSPRGLEIVKEMLKKAHITIENMAPGTIERLGLGYDAVKAINPGIIYCQVKGFGEGSPYEKNLAFDMIAQAAGGPISVTGEADRPPVKPGPSFGDTGTGMLMAISILAALRQRDRTGKGRRLQVAMQDAMIHYMRVPFSRTQLSGKAQLRGGSSRSSTLLGALRTLPVQARWAERLCLCLHQPSQSRALDPAPQGDRPRGFDRRQALRYRAGARPTRRRGRRDHRCQWTRQHSKEEAMKIIGAAGVPAGAVFDTLELLNDPSLGERAIMQQMEHPTTGKLTVPAWPVRFDGAPPKVEPSPLLGQHSAEVLEEWLGIGASEVEALRTEGII